MTRTPPPDEAPARCWSCKSQRDAESAFCDACGVVQPPGRADHFARLGLARGFAVDPAELEKRYFSLQRRLHPDRFANRSAAERALSMQQATTINEAWGVLGDPLRRAEYLLSLLGVTVNAESGNGATDPEVLAEAMEDREAAMEAEDGAAIDRLAADAKARRAACEDALARSFAAGDAAAATGLATRLKYLEKLSGELRARRRAIPVAATA